ncbi:MAG TPA: hypothetical protein VHC49_16055 [Mycobacteriales bacterium]|nr:hypothetical protein [Mycobacteriales bacterium]
MGAKHVTVVAVLVAALVVLALVQVVVAIRLAKDRERPDPRTLVIGLAAAVGAHLTVYGLTGSPWPAVLAVVPFAVGAGTCVPRPLRPPPRRTRASDAGEFSTVTVPVDGMVAGDGGQVQSKIDSDRETGAEAPLSTSEQQAWESIRRELDET